MSTDPFDIDLFADVLEENDAPLSENDALDEVLQRTEADWGTATVLDFTKVLGYPERPGAPFIEVTNEKVQDAALRFRGHRVTVLNFASGVSPGGGVRFGAMAQEEALCLSSGLLHGLESHLEFYEKNREEGAPGECYDLMIWSEDVPLVCDGAYNPVEPMRMQVTTYPAPNNHRTYGINQSGDAVRSIFHRRCRHVVRQANNAGTEVLILGAWGCGEYGNDPLMVAREFKAALDTQAGSIKHVVFACYGPSQNRDVFKKVLA